MTEQEIDKLARMVREYLVGDSYDIEMVKKFSQLDTTKSEGFIFLKALKREMNKPEVINRAKA